MSKGGFSIDWSEFDEEFAKLMQKTIPDRAEKGLFNAGNEALLDAKNEPPKVPVKEGHLSATGQVKTERKADLIEAAVSFGESNPNEALGQGGAPYAARLHEMEKKGPWTEPDSGPKFLSSKFARHNRKYMATAVETIKEGGK